MLVDGLLNNHRYIRELLVSDFLQNITRSPYFSNINLLVTEKGDIGNVKVIKFKAQARAMRKSAAPSFEG